jgi:hypothetical protein
MCFCIKPACPYPTVFWIVPLQYVTICTLRQWIKRLLLFNTRKYPMRSIELTDIHLHDGDLSLRPFTSTSTVWPTKKYMCRKNFTAYTFACQSFDCANISDVTTSLLVDWLTTAALVQNNAPSMMGAVFLLVNLGIHTVVAYQRYLIRG